MRTSATSPSSGRGLSVVAFAGALARAGCGEYGATFHVVITRPGAELAPHEAASSKGCQVAARFLFGREPPP